MPGILAGLKERSQSAYAAPAPKPVERATGQVRPNHVRKHSSAEHSRGKLRHTFEENDRRNNSNSETDSSAANSVNEDVEDRASDSDSRFYQKVGHFAPQIRHATPQNTRRKTYRNGRTGCNQDSMRTNIDRPQTFWLTMSSLEAGLGGGDDMVKAFGKQTQTT